MQSTDAGPRAADSLRRRYRAFAIRIGLGLGLLAVLFWRYDPRPILNQLAAENLRWFSAAVGLYTVGQVISSWRWSLLASQLGLRGPLNEFLAYYFVNVFTNLFVPGLVGGDAARTLYLGRRHHHLGKAAASVIADRGVGLIALFSLAAACALIPSTPLPPAVKRPTIVAGAIALAALLAAPIAIRLLYRLPRRIARLTRLLAPYLRRPRSLFLPLLISLALQLLIVLGQYSIALGLGLSVPLELFLVCVPIANVTASLPITLNGLGVREATYVVLFGLAGVSKIDAVALGVLWFAATTIGSAAFGSFAFVTTDLPKPPA